jgi:hypothetical protein
MNPCIGTKRTRLVASRSAVGTENDSSVADQAAPSEQVDDDELDIDESEDELDCLVR